MKSMIIVLAVLFFAASAGAQKTGANPPAKAPVVEVVSYTCPMHPDVSSDKAGTCPKCHMKLVPSKEDMKKEVTGTYTCPMHKEVVSGHEGKCPKCNMQLVVDRKGSKQVTKKYTCSMHPEVSGAKGDKCPVCQMDLREVKVKTKKS